MNITSIGFQQDGTIQIEWYEADEQSDHGGRYHIDYITEKGQSSTDYELSVWVDELKEAAQEVIERWIRVRRDLRRPF